MVNFTMLWETYTELKDNSRWVSYSYEYNDENKILFSWLIVPNNTKKNEVRALVERHISERGGIAEFPQISVLPPLIEKLIMECHYSENEMYFIEFDDEEYKFWTEGEITAFADEVRQYGLDKHIKLFNDDTFITVYGGISEIVNWAI